jgi:hypothetical protein
MGLLGMGMALAKRQPINHHQPTKVDHCVHGCPSSAAGTVAAAESEYVMHRHLRACLLSCKTIS